ncbi:SCUBE3 [Branchiostoma lanceolatum]|uniref:SCUBE3 protein n=1 Tax=Branchiostoma lanceolatum TaxID=7740 RepID=A0A8J9VFT3_BRALA|nr:SCUBE3 [Branchiostoma lanceolatum]
MPTILLSNARSLRNKLEEFQCVLSQNAIQIAIVSETWFIPEQPEEMYSIDDFTLFSKPRRDRTGGGVAVYVSGLAICAVYLPPGSPHQDILNVHLIDTIDQLRAKLSQEYSSEKLVVQGGDQQIAAAITEMYTTALTTELKDWLESIKDNPKPFSFVLRLVSDLLNIPFDSLFPAGQVDYGCFGRRNLKIEKGTGRKYYTQKTAKPVDGNKLNVSETVTISEIRYCDFVDRKDLKDSMVKRRLALERAVTVYLEEGRLLSTDFLLPAGEAGCETAMLAYLQGSKNGVPTWKEIIGGKEFTVIFDMPYDVPGILQAQDVLQLKFIGHMWFSTRKGSVPHLYDGYNNGGTNDVQGKKVSVHGLVMTYDEGTGVFTVTEGDFKASALLLPNLPGWIKNRRIARAEYKKLLNHLSQKSDTIGDVPCSIQWTNAHRFDPTNGGKCIHFTAASEGDIFVVFASIPENHETWMYIQISPEGVALYKAMRLQTTQLNDNAGGLGSATLYQSYFVCVTEDVKETNTVIQYGKTPDNEERPHVWLSFTFNELASLRYYSFGNGGFPVKVMGLSLLDSSAKEFIICREGTEIIKGICQQKCHSECKGCRTSGSNSPADCIACKHLKLSYPYMVGRIGSFKCLAHCPKHMKAVTDTKTCICIKKMEEARPDGVMDCVTECPLTHFDDNNVCKKCSTFCKDNVAMGKRVCSGPASKDCDTCKYQHERHCVEGCKPGQKAVKTGESGTTCHKCQAGHECKLGDEREDICPAGSASNEERTKCEPCAAGEFSSTPGAASCHKCPAGKYSTGGGSTTCLPCPAGKYSSTAGSTGCTVCSAGSYSSTAGSSSCTACPAGKYSDAKESTGCKACPAGKYSSKVESTSCLNCAVGQYTDSTGSSSCKACPAGQYSSTTASTSCRACPTGKYSSTAGSTSCTACIAGKYSTTAASTSCMTCPAGRYSGTAASTSCTACPAGKYGSTAGSTTCMACPAGKYSGTAGSTSCSACPAVGYSNWNRGEPNNHKGREDCVELRYGKWNDVPCSNGYRYICEIKLPPGHY